MTKVVPFERPAAYWRAHARRHDTPDKRPAAAKMLRKALEKTAGGCPGRSDGPGMLPDGLLLPEPGGGSAGGGSF